MKKKLTLLITILCYVNTYAQQAQQITYDIDNKKLSMNNPSLPGQVVAEKDLEIKIIGTDLTKIDTIEFYSEAPYKSYKLCKPTLPTLNSGSKIIIKNKKISNITGTGEIPFPFKIEVTYNQLIQQATDLIGSGAPVVTPKGGGKDTLIHGSIINDVLTIKNLLDKKRGKDAQSFVQHFYYENKNIKMDDNLFLKDVFTEAAKTDGGGGAQAGYKDFIGSAVSSLGGLDVTTIADGFAKFIVKRTKEELTMAFFQRFRDDLDKYPDIKTLFPQTEKLLQAMGDEIYDYTNYLSNLREAFNEDLKTLDENLPGIIDNHEDFFKRKNNFEFALALRSGCYLSTAIRQEVHPGDILKNYPTSFFSFMPTKEDSARLMDLRGSIQTLQMFSESLKESDTSKHSYWVDSKKVQQVIADKTALKIYLGLLIHSAQNNHDSVKFDNKESFYSLLNKSEILADYNASYPVYKHYIITLNNQVKELEKMINSNEKPKNDSAKVEQYADYTKKIVRLIQQCTKVSTLPHIKKIERLNGLDKKFDTYFDIAVETSNLAVAINRRNYPQAVNEVVIIYDQVIKIPAKAEEFRITKNIDPKKKERIAIIDKVLAANIANPNQSISSVLANDPDLKNAEKDLNKDTAKVVDALAKIAKYGALMANMVNAKTSDEVAEVIEAAALPVGSARIKRVSDVNVAINAYVGPYFGAEKIQKLDDNSFEVNNFGLTAPIGISISKGFLTGKNAWSLSLLVSLVDLGTLTAFRFQNDTVSQIPTIQLKHIMSPGAFLSFGLPNCPLSINFGAQVGPNLRNVNAPTSTTGVTYDYSNSVYWRFSASLCVDLPLLNLYTRKKP